MSTATKAKYPILDTTGKVRQWLEQGRGVRVWTNLEIGVSRPNILTPADTVSADEAPHWAYKGGGTLVLKSMDEVTFYQKSGVYYDGSNYWEWNDTPSGRRAAMKAFDTGEYKGNELPHDNAGAPLKMVFEYTLDGVEYRSTDIRPDTGNPLSTRYKVAVVQWVARVD
jgi:hypothetical protein